MHRWNKSAALRVPQPKETCVPEYAPFNGSTAGLWSFSGTYENSDWFHPGKVFVHQFALSFRFEKTPKAAFFDIF